MQIASSTSVDGAPVPNAFALPGPRVGIGPDAPALPGLPQPAFGADGMPVALPGRPGTVLDAQLTDAAMRTIADVLALEHLPRLSIEGTILARTMRMRLLWSRGRPQRGQLAAAMRGAQVGRLAHRTAHATRGAARLRGGPVPGRTVRAGVRGGGGVATSMVAGRVRRGRAALLDLAHATRGRIRNSRIGTLASDLVERSGRRAAAQDEQARIALAMPEVLRLDDDDLVLRLIGGRILPGEPGNGDGPIDIPEPTGIPGMGGAPLRPLPNGGVDDDGDGDTGIAARIARMTDGMLVAVAIALLVPLSLVALAALVAH